MIPYLMKIAPLSILSLVFFSFNAFAEVKNCELSSAIHEELQFEITNSSGNISQGTSLASAMTQIFGLSCEFTGTRKIDNYIFFLNETPPDIKAQLINSGVTLEQHQIIGDSSGWVDVTAADTAPILIGSWLPKPPLTSEVINIGLKYNFEVKKGSKPLKPFDTGFFLLGNHVNSFSQPLNSPIYIRVIGNLTLLCPAPTITVTTQNGGEVNFGTITQKRIDAGEVITRPFSLGMSIPDDCETGLNVSFRLDPNNNTILENKYLDMDNGLQTVIKHNSTDLNFGQVYPIGNIMPKNPITVPYTATLSKIPGAELKPGAFSKTIRIIASY